MNRSHATGFLTSAFFLFAAAAAAAGCAGEPGGADPTASPSEPATTAAEEALTPAITPTQFVGLFGKPSTALGTQSIDCALGEVRLFAGRIPTNFQSADGRLINLSQNTALYSQMGNMYGGDGRTNFALPNLKAVTPNGLSYAVCMYGAFIGP